MMRESYDKVDCYLPGLSEVARKTHKNKEDINNQLGLSEENLYRRTLGKLQVDDTKEKILKLISNFDKWEILDCGAYDENWVSAKNKANGKVFTGKLTKLITKQTLPEEITIYDKLNIQSIIGYLDRENALERLAQKLGESFKKETITLSTNPVDILWASEGATFSSCFNFEGEYASSITSYLSNNYTAIIYTGNPTRKTARAWLHITPCGVVLGRMFGLFDSRAKIDGLISLLRKELKLNIVNDNITINPSIAAYWDEPAEVFTYHGQNEEIDIKWMIEEYMEDNDAEPICGSCGDSNSEDTLLCGCCRLTCTDCGESIDESDCITLEDGDTLCQCCFDDYYFFCEDCGDIEPLDEAISPVDVDGIFCAFCADGKLNKCDYCGDYYFLEDGVKEISGERDIICNHCIDTKDFIICETCGDAEHGKYATEDKCADCAAELDEEEENIAC